MFADSIALLPRRAHSSQRANHSHCLPTNISPSSFFIHPFSPLRSTPDPTTNPLNHETPPHHHAPPPNPPPFTVHPCPTPNALLNDNDHPPPPLYNKDNIPPPHRHQQRLLLPPLRHQQSRSLQRLGKHIPLLHPLIPNNKHTPTHPPPNSPPIIPSAVKRDRRDHDVRCGEFRSVAANAALHAGRDILQHPYILLPLRASGESRRWREQGRVYGCGGERDGVCGWEDRAGGGGSVQSGWGCEV